MPGRVSLFFFLISLLIACSTPPREAAAPPNIVYILADDMGIGDLGCYNPESKAPTPNMDRLAAEGIRFTDAHAGAAVCTPTRYGILTGEYAFRSRLKRGVLGGYDPPLIGRAQTTVAGLLKAQGYHTACIGKWHLGLAWGKKGSTLPLINGDSWGDHTTENVDYAAEIGGGPVNCGFDYGYILPASLDIAPYCYIENRKLARPMTSRIEGSNSQRGVFWRLADIQEGFKLEETLDHFVDRAVSYLQERGSGEHRQQPFFLYLPLTAPHTPWLPREDLRGQSGAGLYGDFVVQVDQGIGRILATLEANRLSENTIVILTSDNGAHWTPADIEQYGHLANHRFRGMKSDVWEGGHREPFLVRWPGVVTPGSTSDEVICHTDLLATCADLLGISLPEGQGVDSYSFLPVLRGDQTGTPLRPYTIHHSIDGMFAVRKGKWKFIGGRGSGGWSSPGAEADSPYQLYDMEADPGESTNLFGSAPTVEAELEAIVARYQQFAPEN